MQGHCGIQSAVKLAVYVALALLLLVGIAHGQTASSDRLTVGGSKLRPDSTTTVRLDGLATTGGTLVLLTDPDGDVTERVLAVGDIPTPFTRDDVAEAITQAWTFSAGITGPLSVTTSLLVPRLTTSSGNLTIDPVGDLVLDPGGDDIVPAVNYGPNVGLPSLKYRSLSVGELFVETLVAQERITTMGGRFTVTPSNVLTRDLAAASFVGTYPTQATGAFCVKYNSFMLNVGGVEFGSKLFMEKNGQIEAFAVLDSVTPTVDPTFGDYCYTVYRNQANTVAHDWLAGDGIIDSGKTGSGMIDQFAVRGLTSASIEGPSIDFLIRTTATWNGLEHRASIGNLNGRYGFATDTFGFAAGEASGANLIATAGSVKLRQGTTDKIVLDGATGDMSLSGSLTVTGAGSFAGSGISIDSTGIESVVPTGAFADGSSYRFAFGNDVADGGIYAYDDASASVLAAIVSGGNGAADYRSSITVNNTAFGTVSVNAHSGPTELAFSAFVNDGIGGSNSFVLTKTSLTIDGNAGDSGTVTVRNAAGSGTCTLTFTYGIKTGGSC